jgi:hypothetical protein
LHKTDDARAYINCLLLLPRFLLFPNQTRRQATEISRRSAAVQPPSIVDSGEERLPRPFSLAPSFLF